MRTIILLVAVVAAFILVSAAIRYNRSAGLFDAHQQKPAKKELPATSNMEKPAR